MHAKTNRKGAVGALLDIYEQAISDMVAVIEDIPDSDLVINVDLMTTDENCKSLQAILSHVVHSGYGYATGIHNFGGDNIERPEKVFRLSIKEYTQDLTNVFDYTQNVFKEINDDELEQLDHSLKIKTGWGQSYDIEQMMEHAIVHVLRHSRQIAKLKKQLH